MGIEKSRQSLIESVLVAIAFLDLLEQGCKVAQAGRQAQHGPGSCQESGERRSRWRTSIPTRCPDSSISQGHAESLAVQPGLKSWSTNL